MFKFRYLCLAIITCVMVLLTSCIGGTPTAENTPVPNTPDTTAHSGHNSQAKININNAILSELDKFEAKLGIPGLSNTIQANRPYGSPEDLVTKKVVNQEQFEQVKDLVSVEEVTLVGEAKDIDYMTKLGLMKGHLVVAKELLDQNQPKQAEPHIGHPVEEIYIDLEDQLNERKIKEFKTILLSLQNLVKSNPKNVKLKTDFAASMQAVENAIAILPPAQRSKPEFVLQVMYGLLDAANSEYGAAIANGKIKEAIEYQDSRGFAFYSKELYQSISSSVAQINPEANTAINNALTELVKAWPSAIPPAQPVKLPEEVNKLIKTIEENSQKVIERINTKAQN